MDAKVRDAFCCRGTPVCSPRRLQSCQVLAELEEWRAKLWFDAAASGSEEQLKRLLELGQGVNDDSSDTYSSVLDGTALHHATLKANSRPLGLSLHPAVTPAVSVLA